MENKELQNKSKRLSYLLRHNPEELSISKDGFISTIEILNKLSISMEQLESIVNENDKKRFSFSEDKTKIKASQGHTIQVEIKMKEYQGENIKIYHGTSKYNLESIKKKGLVPMKRQYVHLTKNIKTAKETGLRYAKRNHDLIVFSVLTDELIKNKIEILISDNEVFQVKNVPYKLLKIEN